MFTFRACGNSFVGSFPPTVTVTAMGYRSYKNPLNKAPLRTVTGGGNDPTVMIMIRIVRTIQ